MTKKIALTLLLLLHSAAAKIAAADFATQVQQTYTLTSTGAQVSQIITITNLTDLLYPKGYSLFLYSDHIQNLDITDQNNHSTEFNQTPVAGNTKIDIPFTQAVVGKNQSQTYRLEYTNPSVLPNPDFPQYIIDNPIAFKPDETITTTVIIPKNICPEPLVYPLNLQLNAQDTFASLTYNQKQLNRAVTISCRSIHSLDFTLTYQLANPALTPIETQITLPPDTSSQRILFRHLEPEPFRLEVDADGNRIASYKLEPKQSVVVTVDASAAITTIQHLYQDSNPDTASLTRDQPLWPSTNGQIKQLVKDLPTAEAIYNYLTQTAKYNPDQFNPSTLRHGGLQIIHKPQDFSGEDFTDAFITLCRAKGILSRRLVSYTTVSNQKITPMEYPDVNIHIYPEWFDIHTHTWIPVDPFWQVTNPGHNYWPVVDQLRLTLAINGQNDTMPYSGNNVSLKTTNGFTFPTPTLTVGIQNSIISKLFPSKTNLVIDNHSNYALYQETFTLTGPDITPTQITLNRLDINAQGIIPITAPRGKQLILETSYGSIPIAQSYVAVSPTVVVTTILVAGASFFAVIAGRLLVQRRKR